MKKISLLLLIINLTYQCEVDQKWVRCDAKIYDFNCELDEEISADIRYYPVSIYSEEDEWYGGFDKENDGSIDYKYLYEVTKIDSSKNLPIYYLSVLDETNEASDLIVTLHEDGTIAEVVINELTLFYYSVQ